jgi:predicted molibdopterin-dependent oxidoreductase YjgC
VRRDPGRRFGLAGAYPTAAAIFDEIAAGVPAFAGMSHRALGETGAPVRGA